MTIHYSKRFKKQFHLRLSAKMKRQFGERLGLFLFNPHHPQLNVHALVGKHSGCWSVNVSGDMRAIFEYRDEESTVLFLVIGTHSQIY